DHVFDRKAGNQRRAEITLQYIAYPLEELHGYGLVQPHVVAYLLDLLHRGPVACHDGGGVPRGEPEHTEYDDRHHQQHRDGGSQPFRNDEQHQSSVFSIFQKTGTGASSMPLSDLPAAATTENSPSGTTTTSSMASFWTSVARF